MRVWTVFDDWMERHFLLPLWDHHECREVLVILKDFFLRQKNQVIDAAECPGNSSDQHQLSILE